MKASQTGHGNADGQTEHKGQRNGHAFLANRDHGIQVLPNARFAKFLQLAFVQGTGNVGKRNVGNTGSIYHGQFDKKQKVAKIAIIEIAD
jgi:hypothetical protein